LAYGGTSENIVSYPFSSLFNKEVLKNSPSKAIKEALKKKLDIHYEKVILSVGRFITCKGYDILIKACAKLPSNVGIYLIGGVPPKEYIDLINEFDIKNIHFVDFMPREHINEYYQLSDFFVLPTRGDTWGLVINEAMANGCPVITTDNCVAGSELIENGKNGYIVSVGDVEELNQRMIELLNYETKCTVMAQNNIEKICYYTLENMAKVHYDILSKFLNIK
ncbi:MAG: glycosyltransferase family 4 protein, partial [Muribaculaceae bacterium]